MSNINLSITIPEGAQPILEEAITSALGELGDDLTLKKKGELYVSNILKQIYHQQAKSKGGRDYNNSQVAARKARSNAESTDLIDRKRAESDAEAAAKIVWS